MTSEQKEDVLAALYRRAVGYTVTEENSEFVLNADGVWETVKRKVSLREIPPELSAIKTLLEAKPDDETMSEQQLVAERDRLLAMLQEKSRKQTGKAPIQKNRKRPDCN